MSDHHRLTAGVPGGLRLLRFEAASGLCQSQHILSQMQANEANYKKQISDQAATIEALSKQIEDLKNNASGEGELLYVVTDGPISFRTSPSRQADLTTYNGKDYAYNDDKFKVIEVVKGTDDADYSWAKVADKVYFCLGTDSEVWAKPAN